MARWLAFFLLLTVLSRIRAGNVANAAHLGGAVAGAVIGALWRPRVQQQAPWVTASALAASAATLVACIAVVSVHDRLDRFATMGLQERSDFTRAALGKGHCREAQDGLRAVERLRARMAPVTSLRSLVETDCGHAQ
jgi:hypothetical protein